MKGLVERLRALLAKLSNAIRSGALGYLAIILIIFFIGLILSVVYWRSTENTLKSNASVQFKHQLARSESIITQRLQQYATLLDAGSSLLQLEGNQINQSQWNAFFGSYNLTKKYPGVAAVSFSQYVTQAGMGSYLANMAAQGNANFTITPSGNRSAYAPITYVGSAVSSSYKTFGYDQLSDPVRAAAITSAINSGNLAMSGKVKLVGAQSGQSAFVLYRPIYLGPSASESERQSSIYGVVFAAINNQSFFNSLLKQYTGPGVDIEIYDSLKPNANLLMYQTPGYSKSHQIKNGQITQVKFDYGGHYWTIKVILAKNVSQDTTASSPTPKLIIGILLSALLAGLVWYFTAYRERKISWQKEHELQTAKDDLLTLASHQLRTPATTAKQYLGVLLENYAGTITDKQRKIIQTAYESNERQLRIANQFLSAARLDSGSIKIRSVDTDLNQMLRQVIDEQKKIAKDNSQQIVFKPGKKIMLQSDPYYLPMVFENLISNAIKYSKRRTKITVTSRKSDGFAEVTVSDTGIGIPEEEVGKLFDKFTRIYSDQNADANGSGIGLYLVKQITNLHNGSIEVRSKPNKGSKFIVRLPIR